MASNERYFELVETAYEFSEDPSQFEDLLTVASHYLFDERDGVSISPDLPRHSPLDKRLDRHLARLSRLLEASLAELDATNHASHYAAIKLEKNSRTITGNEIAARLFETDFPCKLDDLPFDHRTASLLASFTKPGV